MAVQQQTNLAIHVKESCVKTKAAEILGIVVVLVIMLKLFLNDSSRVNENVIYDSL